MGWVDGHMYNEVMWIILCVWSSYMGDTVAYTRLDIIMLHSSIWKVYIKDGSHSKAFQFESVGGRQPRGNNYN